MPGIIKPLRELMDQHPKLWSGDLQWQIAEFVTGDANLFEFQSEVNQENIFASISEHGITKVINQATNQTDIMEELQQVESMPITDNKSLQTSADSGEILNRKQMATILDRQLKSAMTDIYIASSEIIDHKLYQELGYSTAASYFETLAISERKAYQYAVIGRELRPHAYLSDGKENPKAKQTANLGYSKLEEIVRHAKDQIDNLIQNGQIQIGGETLSREEIESKSVRDLRNQLKEAKAAKEENERLKYENKHLERSVEDLKEDNERLAKYKTGITQEKEVREALESFSAHISDAIRFARGVKLAELDEHLQAEVVKRINTGFDLLERYSAEHAEIFTVHAD
jgi:flagellar motility protein MotE (MotC chaperone)